MHKMKFELKCTSAINQSAKKNTSAKFSKNVSSKLYQVEKSKTDGE